MFDFDVLDEREVIDELGGGPCGAFDGGDGDASAGPGAGGGLAADSLGDSEGSTGWDDPGALPSLHVAAPGALAERLGGAYYPCGSLNGRLAFKRAAHGARAAAYVYLAEAPGGRRRGWQVGAELDGAETWAWHPDATTRPPARGWRVPPDSAEPLLTVAVRSGAGRAGGCARAAGQRARGTPPFRCLLYHGTVYLPYMDPGLLDDLRRDFVLQHRDVVVVSHPRCGTTWCQTIVLGLLHRGRPRVRDPMLEAPWIEASLCKGRTSVAELGARGGGTGALRQRCLKTHAPAHLAPWRRAERGARLLLVTRDPRDAAVSHYHHIVSSSAYRFRGSWDDFCQLFLDGLVEGGDFWRWHEGWARRAGDARAWAERVLWVRYEDLILDLEGQVQRIAAFLDIQGLCRERGLAELTSADIRAVVAAVQFDAMSDLFRRRNVRKKAKGKKFDPQHIRVGVAGGWPELMSDAQAEMFSGRTCECTAPMWTVPHWECET